jgi:biopolymer transport protein ExbB
MSGFRNWILIVVFVISVVISWFIWDRSPEYIRQGGPLLVFGLTLLFLAFTFGLERLLVLWRAGGRGGVPQFIRNVKQAVHGGDLSAAIEACRRQGGCLANVVGAGLERFAETDDEAGDPKERIDETRRAIREASALETPLLERNLTALSTIASIATLVGLLGTTIGMIRAFRAMSHAGAPDATQLALGISEALVNTALGLTTAVVGTVLYNYFATRVDAFRDTMDETSFTVVRLLESRKES